MTPPSRDFGDFTEESYRRVLRVAKRTWRFVTFPESAAEGRICLWRHDIDCSPHRALRLAEIEVDEACRATYFVHFHSEFYNVLERGVVSRLRRIGSLGHAFGLHFDPGFYDEASQSAETLVERAAAEGEMLAELLSAPIQAVSLHNPTPGMLERWRVDAVAGMVNAYGDRITQRFSYVSDSNGYWRFRPLRDVVKEGTEERLHVLTHPEWWVREPMSPRRRIARCVEGRAAFQLASYDASLAEAGRENIR